MPAVARKVGIRELKAHLSRVVQEAARGQHFAVTDHGTVVAELGPPSTPCNPDPDVTARLLAWGGTTAAGPFDLLPPPRSADWQVVDVVAVLDGLRGDR